MFRHDLSADPDELRSALGMSRRRNGTNQAMVQLGLNRYKLGKKKRPGAATPAGAKEKSHIYCIEKSEENQDDKENREKSQKNETQEST